MAGRGPDGRGTALPSEGIDGAPAVVTFMSPVPSAKGTPVPALRPALAATLLALVVPVLSGCAGTSVQPLYRNAAYGSPPVKRIFVAAQMPDRARPAEFENAIAQALTAKGYQVATATGVFPPGTFDKFKLREYLAQNGADLVVLERLTSRSEPVVVTSTAVVATGYAGVGTVAGGTQSTVVGVDTEVTARIEVFDARTEPNTLVWVGQSTETDLSAAPQSIAKAFVTQLVDARILAP